MLGAAGNGIPSVRRSVLDKEGESIVELAKDDLIPEGTSRNLTAYAPHTVWANDVPDHERVLMSDNVSSPVNAGRP